MLPVKKFRAASFFPDHIQDIVFIIILNSQPRSTAHFPKAATGTPTNLDFSLTVYVDKMTQTGNVQTALKNCQFTPQIMP